MLFANLGWKAEMQSGAGGGAAALWGHAAGGAAAVMVVAAALVFQEGVDEETLAERGPYRVHHSVAENANAFLSSGSLSSSP